MKTPCSNRVKLFEPYLRPGESTDVRGYRLDRAKEVCKMCPIQAKEKCFAEGQKNKFARGVWGGLIRTSLTTEKDFRGEDC